MTLSHPQLPCRGAFGNCPLKVRTCPARSTDVPGGETNLNGTASPALRTETWMADLHPG